MEETLSFGLQTAFSAICAYLGALPRQAAALTLSAASGRFSAAPRCRFGLWLHRPFTDHPWHGMAAPSYGSRFRAIF